MGRKKLVRKSKSGSEKKSGPWRPSRRQVLWAVGTLLALVTIALLVGLLVVNLDAVKLEDLSRERIEQVALFIGIAVAATTLIVLLAIGGARRSWTGFQGKTVWDFLQLLIVPLMLVAIGLVFSLQQDARQQRVEEQRADAERELAERRAQDEALQAYLNQMSNLLLENDLRESKEDSEVRTLARARTLTVLGRLDPSRKTAVMQFLVEADLVQRVDGRDPIIFLHGANLSEAHLRGANLRGAVLSGANLRGANLIFADLIGANLVEAVLRGANLRYTRLDGADLRYATLSEARGWTEAQLTVAKSLEGATMPDGQTLKGYTAESRFGPTFDDWLKNRERRKKDSKDG